MSSQANYEINCIKNQINSLKKRIKQIEKEDKKKSASGTPVQITKELSEFLNKPEGTIITNLDAGKEIIQYIKKNKLEKKKIIIPDDKLKLLLDINEGDELTYYNLPNYLKKHFIKID